MKVTSKLDTDSLNTFVCACGATRVPCPSCVRYAAALRALVTTTVIQGAESQRCKCDTCKRIREARAALDDVGDVLSKEHRAAVEGARAAHPATWGIAVVPGTDRYVSDLLLEAFDQIAPKPKGTP